jgi:hypothetical protein
MKHHVNLSRAFLGGFVATVIFTTILYLAPLVGIPRMDIAARLGTLFGHGVPAVWSGLWWLGMIWHFANGALFFPLLYSYFIYGVLPAENWVRGMVWGILLWVLMEMILVPLTGGGFFNEAATLPAYRLLFGFLLHAIYGTTFGVVAGEQAQRGDHLPQPA